MQGVQCENCPAVSQSETNDPADQTRGTARGLTQDRGCKMCLVCVCVTVCVFVLASRKSRGHSEGINFPNLSPVCSAAGVKGQVREQAGWLSVVLTNLQLDERVKNRKERRQTERKECISVGGRSLVVFYSYKLLCLLQRKCSQLPITATTKVV